MAYKSNMSFVERLEHRNTAQPKYHADDVCGSSFHGLAYSLQIYAQENNVNEGLEQIKRCIDARQQEMRSRAYPDPSHNEAIRILTRLYLLYTTLRQYDENYLGRTVVSFDDREQKFTIFVNDKRLYLREEHAGGKKHKSRKRTRKNKSRKKTRKNKLYRKSKRNKY